VLLLGDVRELEVRRERAQHSRLPLESELTHGGGEILVRRTCPCGACERPDALDVVEELLPVLLDEDAAEEVAEQADVSPERRVGWLVGTDRHASSVGRFAAETGQSLGNRGDPR